MSASTRTRLVEGAHQVLAVRRVDRRLAADRGIDLGQERCRDLDQGHATLEAGGCETRQIAHHAAAERHHAVAAFEFHGQQAVAHGREPAVGFGAFSRGHQHGAVADASGIKTGLQRTEMVAGDVFVADDPASGAGRQGRDAAASRRDQAWTDKHLVGARAQRDRNAHGRRAGRRSKIRVGVQHGRMPVSARRRGRAGRPRARPPRPGPHAPARHRETSP